MSEELDDSVDAVEAMTQRQPTRTGRQREERRFDRTQLKSSHHGRYVHRDYAAHFFRWGWVARHLKRGARVLDVGCGQELPLMWVLSGNMSVLPSYYLGVDLNKVEFSGSPKWAHVLGEFSFVDRFKELGHHLDVSNEGFDAIISLECLEHMNPVDGRQMFEGFKHWLKDDGYVYLSTPVFDGHAAANHCHEYTITELQSLLESVGFKVEARYGTFASANDIKRAASPEDLKVWEKLYDYYGGDVLSTFLAPLYPDASRNNLWVLRKQK